MEADTAPVPAMAKALSMNLLFSKAPVYVALPGKSHQLMSVQHSVTYENFGTGTTIESKNLPFGLVEGVVVTFPACLGPAPTFRLVIQKLTGQRTTGWHSAGQTALLVHRDLTVDFDFQNEDFGVVKAATGHDMRHRMLSAQSLIKLSVETSVPVERSVVTFLCANAIPAEFGVDEAVALLAERRPLALLFRPLLPSARWAAATQKIQAMERQLDPAGAAASAAAK